MSASDISAIRLAANNAIVIASTSVESEPPSYHHHQLKCSLTQGNQVFYRLANPRMLQAFDLIRELLYEQMSQEGLLTSHLEQERANHVKRSKSRPAAYR